MTRASSSGSACFGDWDDPYLTMDFRYQAAIARALGTFVEQGLVYKGKKPVHWCIHCRTALAEAEVEYEDHTSPSIYVEFPLAPTAPTSSAARIPALAGRARLGAHLDDDAVDDPVEPRDRLPSRVRLRAPTRSDGRVGDRRRGARRDGRRGDRQAVRRAGRAMSRAQTLERLALPASALRPRRRSACSADYVTLEAGHRRGAHRARPRRRRLRHRRAYGLDIYAPVGPGGTSSTTVELFAGQQVFDANPNVEEALHGARRGSGTATTSTHQYPHCWRCHNPVIFLATSQWFIAHGRRIRRSARRPSTLRDAALDAIDRTCSGSRRGAATASTT